MIKPKKYLTIKIEQPDGSILAQKYFNVTDYNTEVVRSANFYKELDWMIQQLEDTFRAQDLDFMFSKNDPTYNFRENGFNKKWRKEITEMIAQRHSNPTFKK